MFTKNYKFSNSLPTRSLSLLLERHHLLPRDLTLASATSKKRGAGVSTINHTQQVDTTRDDDYLESKKSTR
jgi:hypothetical protein